MSHTTIRSGTGAFGGFLRLSVLGFCLLSATHVYADTVTPSADVSTGVVVRASASAQSAAIATLLPGRELELVGSVPYWHEVRLPNGSTGFVSIGPHSEVHGRNAHPGRLLWNIETADVKGDFERFKAAGAIVIAEPYGFENDPNSWIATFADLDDNYFQLMSPMDGGQG